MELLETFTKLGVVSDVSFAETLLRKITNDFYYVINLTKVPVEQLKMQRSHVAEQQQLQSEEPTEATVINQEIELPEGTGESIYVAKVLKITGESKTIPERIRLFDQPAKGRVGSSLPTISLCTTSQLTEQINHLYERFQTDQLKDIVESGIYYNENKADFYDVTGEYIKGYTTLAVDGKYLVETLLNYDETVINSLYETNKYEGTHACYLCGEQPGVFCGSMKDPAWKLITTTRKNEINGEQHVFIRCYDCEYNLMKGMYLLRQFTRVSRSKTRNLERVIIPCTLDKRLWTQLLKLREETESDLKYYQVVERLYERFARRGLSQFIEVNVLRTNRSYGVLSTTILTLDDVRSLCVKEKYERFLYDNGWLSEKHTLDFYPDELIAYKDDYKWRIMDRIKRFWLGYENKDLWDHVKQLIPLKPSTVAIYQTWLDYKEMGEDKLQGYITHQPSYIAGLLTKEVGKLETKYLALDLSNRLHNRFMNEKGNSEYIINECLKVYTKYKEMFREENAIICEKIEELFQRKMLEASTSINYFSLGRYESTVVARGS